jgi:hypothetical protein
MVLPIAGGTISHHGLIHLPSKDAGYAFWQGKDAKDATAGA